MSEQVSARVIELEQNYAETSVVVAREISETILCITALAVQLARVYRVPRYDMDSRENDVEHSYLLAMLAACVVPLLKAKFPEQYHDIEVGEAVEFALCHELIELVNGDEQTFTITDEDLAAKNRREDAAVEQLCAQLPERIADRVRRYQTHAEPAVRIVGLLDKIAPTPSMHSYPDRPIK